MRLSLSLGALLVGAASASLYGESDLNHTCVLSPKVLSCSAGAVASKVDSCCVETFGGLVLSTQYWDTYTGLESEDQLLPQDSWTLHGLWPDFCNSSYTQYCDLSRQYDPSPSPNTTNGESNGTAVPAYTGPPVSTFIEAFGKYDLLAYMNKYWVNQGAPNWHFWAHEFSKHATCYSTFDLPCYGPQYVPHADVVQFYETAILYFQRLPTWAWLADAGITPSNTTSYSISKIEAVLAEKHGAVPYLGCSGEKFNETAKGNGTLDAGYTVLDEVWYYHHVFGRPQDGLAVPVNASIAGSITTCATTPGAVRYLERTNGSVAAV